MGGVFKMSTVQAFLDELGPHFPEMGGRLFEVTDIDDISKDTIPKMPLAVGAFLRIVNSNPNALQMATVDETFIIEFWYEPLRYAKADGSESPFWAAFDHSAVIQKVVDIALKWISPNGSRLIFQEANLDCSPMAIMLAIKFSNKYHWCEDVCYEKPDGLPMGKIKFSLYSEGGPCADTNECEVEADCEKCPTPAVAIPK
jgi:hypothetical protein